MEKLLITGTGGFVGKNVLDKLLLDNTISLFPVSSSSIYDLRKPEVVEFLYSTYKPDVVVHLAGRVGGILANRNRPADFFYDNMQMGMNMIKYANLYKVKNFIMTGTVCSYPKFTKVPFAEGDLWLGYPEETNAPYGVAKRSLIEMLGAYNKQYGLQYTVLVPTNMYGPHDNVDETTSHVIPAIIMKVLKAQKEGRKYIELWGDGTPTREFLHVSDFTKAVSLAIHGKPINTFVNIGNGKEYSIDYIAKQIMKLMHYEVPINYDTSKPNGQPRRCLSVEKAKNLLGFEAATDIITGLAGTIKCNLLSV